MARVYFFADCNACEEKFSSDDPAKVEKALDKHFMQFHPERYHTRLDLPMVYAARLSDEMTSKMFPKSYSTAFKESMR